MFKNRFSLIAAVFLVLVASLAVSNSSANTQKSTDLSGPVQPVVIPITGAAELSDYYERHSELSGNVEIDRTTLYQNYPGAWVSRSAGVALPLDSSLADVDYYQRHPELSIPSDSIDLSDYFARHPRLGRGLPTSPHTILNPSLVDECFDVSVNEVAACREASQSASK